MRWIPFAAIIVLVNVGLVASVTAQQPVPPADVAQVIDFSKFPLVGGVLKTNHAVLAGQSYLTQGGAEAVAQQIQARLKADGWKELPGAMATAAYATAMYEKQGFTVNLTLTPGSEPSTVLVNLINYGNLPLTSLPLPAGFEEAFSTPAMRMANGAQSVEQAQHAMRDALAEAGWQPYGEAAGSFFVKRGTIRLQVAITNSPAQGKTVIQLSTVQLSADLPAPADAINLQYSDPLLQLTFDSMQTPAAVLAYYVEELSSRGWKATTDNPVLIDRASHLIFHNPAEELIEVAVSEAAGKSRARVKYMTAEAVDAENRKAETMAAKARAAAAASGDLSPLDVTIPMGAKIASKTAKSAELTVEPSKAQAAVAAWLKAYEADGWKVTANLNQPVAGDFTLIKGDARLSVTFTDPGFIPASITIRTTGTQPLSFKDATP